VALVVWGASVIAGGHLSALETVGLVFGIGLSSGALGINVAHELVHKHVRFENALGYAMLVSVFYTHWGLEHVKGHHRWVATERDPATARFGQSFYAFWPQTVFGAFVSSWRIEKHLLSRKGHGAWTWRNKVLQGLAAQAVFVVLLGRTWGAAAVAYYAAQSLVAISLLEIVNYLEHYGLTRKALGPDQFERVTPLHSWNASNALTNYFLFNLQRHSDHHAKPARRYPILRHFDESPQLPTGYAGMVLLAAVPPLWRAVMDRRVRAHRAKVEAGA
jgi:alkane 1-monooxygenase